MKTKINFLKTLAIIVLFLNSNYLIAQTNTSPTQTVCAGSLAEPYLINPPSSGSTYQWSLTGGGIINSGSTTDNITIDWGVTPGTYIVSIIETDVNGCLGIPVTVDVTVLPLPSATTANNQTSCFGFSAPNLTAVGSNVSWYTDVSLLNNVYQGNSFPTGQTAIGVYTYYVTETLNGCEGPSISVTLEIYSLPTSPSTSSQTACLGTTIPDLTASGSNLNWYSDAGLNNNVGSGNTYSTGQTSTGVYTYYVSETDLNGCESSATSVILEIYSLPSSPSSNNVSACFGSSIPDLTATGSNINWYSDAGLTNNVGSGNTYSTGQTVVGVYTYYLTETDVNGCESNSTAVDLEIYSLPTVPSAIDEVACEGGIIPNLTASGSNPIWYADAALTTVVGSGSSFSTGQTITGVYTYYVTETNTNGCESAPTTVTLTINSFNTMPAIVNETACFGSTIPDLTASGVGANFNWYSDASLTNLVSTSNPFATGQTGVGIYTYYVTETQNGCESPAAIITLEIYTTPLTGPINHW
jgi:hypothetical protein